MRPRHDYGGASAAVERRGFRTWVVGVTVALVLLTAALAPSSVFAQPQQSNNLPIAQNGEAGGHEIIHAVMRLPLAAVLGTALALRPRRRGTPQRTAPVVQTQIILAIVGALVMLVVGASLARAFGIVGAANLIRYRSKIDDPKDAGVMLCALAVGLAAGVGLYGLSTIATLFLVGCLAIIESFEPKKLKHFLVQVKVEKKDAQELRPKVEGVLSRFRLKFELRTAAEEELSYDVNVPMDLETDTVTDALLKSGGDAISAVNWDQKKKAEE